MHIYLKTIIVTFCLTCFAAPAGLAMAKKQVLPASSQAAETDLVWVSKSDKAVSCEKDSGVELFTMETELKTAGVTVVDKRKLHDTKMRIQMCGIEKGSMNGFQISKKDLDKALKLGFELVPPGVPIQ